ncbi:MAG: 30S ribosomal protein S4 [Clostridia bacterium]|nr:30S ribosomal protein S4 [Clostridia bacterium]
MARYTEADCRLCRREGAKLFLKGERCLTKKCAMERRPVNPGVHPVSRKKPSEYQTQLREKQKVKRAYNLLERQFHGYYVEAERMKGKTGENMLSLLERRLDNVVYRMGLASSRAAARQLVSHGHICVDGKNVNIPSFEVKVGNVISVKENKQKKGNFASVRESRVVVPKWLEFNPEKLEGKVVALPAREDIDLNIEEHLIIELYSK